MKNLILFLCLSIPSFAMPSHQVSFDEIRRMCKDPAEFQRANKPAHLNFECAERSTDWKEVKVAKELGVQSEILFAGSADSFDLPAKKKLESTASKQIQCTEFREVAKYFVISFDSNCDEILDFQGSNFDFCRMKLEKAHKGGEFVEPKEKETGKTQFRCQ